MWISNEVKTYNSAGTINRHNKMQIRQKCESPEVELCKSVVLEQMTTPVEDNRKNNRNFV